eukprot:gene10219-21307_t
MLDNDLSGGYRHRERMYNTSNDTSSVDGESVDTSSHSMISALSDPHNTFITNRRNGRQQNYNVPRKHNKMMKAVDVRIKSGKNIRKPNSSLGPEISQKYRYQLWEGRNKFICGGRIMMGVHANHLSVSLTMVFFTWLTYLGLIVPLMNLPICYIIGLLFFFFNVLFLLITAFTEPGIIPRRPPSQLLESMSEEMRDKVQYCHTCRIVRPPRAKHCRYCDNCVEVFDHHCPWTGTCIGVRNYRYFFTFVSITVLGSIFVFASTVYIIVGWIRGAPTDQTLIRDISSPIVCGWALLVIILVGSLLLFHIFLVGRGQTTNEFLRGGRPSKDTTTPSSFCANFCKICFCDTPESKLLPMWQKPTAEDHLRDVNAVVHAISSLRNAIENNTL